MLFSLKMHLKPTLSVCCALQSSTNLADLHTSIDLTRHLLFTLSNLLATLTTNLVAFTCRSLLAIKNGLKLDLLRSMLLDFEHDLFRFLDISLFSLLLSVVSEKINLLL